MPAAAVIPAPVAYIKVVAVKKLVVGFLVWQSGPLLSGGECWAVHTIFLDDHSLPFIWRGTAIQIDYFEKIRVFKAGLCCEYISME